MMHSFNKVEFHSFYRDQVRDSDRQSIYLWRVLMWTEAGEQKSDFLQVWELIQSLLQM